MIASKVLSSWSQSSGCKQVGTDGELTSEIPSLHRPSHHLCGKQRRDTQLLPFAHDTFIWFPYGAEECQYDSSHTY